MASMIKEKRHDKRKTKSKQLPEKNVEVEKNYVEQKSSLIVSEEKPLESSSKCGDLGILPECKSNQLTNENTAVYNDLIGEEKEIPEVILGEQCVPTNCSQLKGDSVLPSAPILEVIEPIQSKTFATENVLETEICIPKMCCMPLEEAIRMVGGKELDEVKVLSATEEAIVQAGPQSGPDHPLVDLLSTFRTSLVAIEHERNNISCGYNNEEKSRATLWKVIKRQKDISEMCQCGATVSIRAVFDVATLQTEKLPTARFKLESLLKDVQEGYCHHQHAALRAHYDVDELLAEILQGDKGSIREALMLILEALRLSDTAPDSFAQALQRWASILSFSLLEGAELRDLLFLLHSLFRRLWQELVEHVVLRRQTRSVRWGARALRRRPWRAAGPARLLAVLELLLTCPDLDDAIECTEEAEAWEEVGARGAAGGVGAGRLRERDVLALLDALPLADLVAGLLLLTAPSTERVDEQSWADKWFGRGVLQASCGVRVLLDVLLRALAAHASYSRLRVRLRSLASAALSALAALHFCSRDCYAPDLRERINVELEACFAAGIAVLGDEAHRAPAALLRDDVARDYCGTLIGGLHDEHTLYVKSLRAQCARQSCAQRVRTLTYAALHREQDDELAHSVLDFLFQVGVKRKSAACKGSCDDTAQELLPFLLTQRQLHTRAFHILSDLFQGEAVDPSVLERLAPQQWRPDPPQLSEMLGAGSRAHLVPHLLLQLDYTPHSGVGLESQQWIGNWLCSWLRARGETPEWAWRILRALRLHRTQWGLPLEAPPHEGADDLLSVAYALMATDWGHCIPLICGPGVQALCRLAESRPADAAWCAGPLMRVMAQSPESVSLTPKFAEVFTAILNWGPNLMQRAFGRRGSSGQELLQQTLVEHMHETMASRQSQCALLSGWMHALWRPGVPGGGRAALDAALRVCRDWRTLDAHAASLLQEANAKEYLIDAVRHVSAAPLLCEALLRHAHGLELHTQLNVMLLDELARQRAASLRIHVDNALKRIGSALAADELAIHRCASAALATPQEHPAHLLLWRLLLHMFLQRPPATPSESTPPVGPLFFSGIVKSRVLLQLKKRLQETASYHHTRADALKATSDKSHTPTSIGKAREAKLSVDRDFIPSANLFDLAGETDSESDSNLSDGDSSSGGDVSVSEVAASSETKDLISYHTAAEKVVREYTMWLEEGERVRASPHLANIARFVSDRALQAAWGSSLAQAPPAPDTPPAPVAPPTAPCERAVRELLHITPKTRYKIPALQSTKDDKVPLEDTESLIETINKYIKELEALTRAWLSDVDRVKQIDAQLWELVKRLRVARPLPPVKKPCPQQCKPTRTLTIHILEDEWCVSSGAQQAVHENRRSARAALRQLARPRARDARLAARLHALAKRVRSRAAALRVGDAGAAAAARLQPYAPAHGAVCALVADVATRFISADAKLAAECLERWSEVGGAACLALVSPGGLAPRDWPRLYAAVLRLRVPPHATFSYLSKFDFSIWADVADTHARSAVLEALLEAARRWGPRVHSERLVLLELLGVHCRRAVRAPELRAHVLRCAHAAMTCGVPSVFLDHLAAVVDRWGEALDFDQLGHSLRELGLMFWSARSAQSGDPDLLAEYAPHLANTLRALLRAFVAAAVARTYAPDRVVENAWGAAHEAWGAWLQPHALPPLLRCADGAPHYADMLARFRDAVEDIAHGCPGSEDALLRHVFEWAAGTYLRVEASWPQESRVQMSALLAHLAALPWECQWFHVDVLQLSLRVSRSSERELTSWCSSCMRNLRGVTWIRGVPDDQLAPTLAALLEMFTSKLLSLPFQTLEDARVLPWERLPEPALCCALERFFSEHHSPAVPYHHAPQFRIMLAASLLLPGEEHGATWDPRRGEKRAAAVSAWVRATSSPALLAHVPQHTESLLHALASLAPHLDEGSGQLEQLLTRAVVVLCAEPAASCALPVWREWVGGCGPRLRRACAASVPALTAPDYFAALGDAVARATLADPGSAGWAELSLRWAECAWAEAGPLAARGALHASYAAHVARPHSAQLRRALDSLVTLDVNFVESEAIAALWVCVAGRAGREGEERAARALLLGWAERRRTLLQVVTLHSADACPTPRLRLLCRLALCVVSASEADARAFEAACAPPLGPAEAAAWAREARPRHLPRLAALLYPQHELYFKEELASTGGGADGAMVPATPRATPAHVDK